MYLLLWYLALLEDGEDYRDTKDEMAQCRECSNGGLGYAANNLTQARDSRRDGSDRNSEVTFCADSTSLFFSSVAFQGQKGLGCSGHPE